MKKMEILTANHHSFIISQKTIIFLKKAVSCMKYEAKGGMS
jgi:hypothetical protein